MRRDDLAGLTDPQLAALGNVGLLKRARREVEAGRGPTIEVLDDGTLVGSSPDGAVSRIGRDIQLSLGTCTCGATRACRHRLASILVYQSQYGGAGASAWDPGAFSDAELEALLGTRLLERARKEATALAVRVQPGATPAAELPTVTVSFWARDALHLARCDCGRSPCEHIALAVWAFRRAALGERATARGGLETPGMQGGLVVLGGAGAGEVAAALSRIEHALEVLLAEGVAELADTRLLAEARAAARHEGFVWLADALEDLEREKEHYDRRSTVFRVERVVEGVAEISARIRAATTKTPALPRGYVLGADLAAGGGRIDRLRLIGIGAAIEPDGSRRVARAYFVEPISSTVLALHKEWDFGERPPPAGAAIGDLFASSRRSLRELCAGYTVARGASRRDNGLLDLDRARSLQPSNPSGAMWSEIQAPVRIVSLAAHGAQLDQSAPGLLGPRLVGRGVHVLCIDRVVDLGYSQAHQEMVAIVADTEGTMCTIRSQHRDASPGRVDAIYRGLASGTRLLSGRLRRNRHGWQLRVLAHVDAAGRVSVPDIEAPRPLEKAARPTLFGTTEESPLFTDLRHLLERAVHRGLRVIPSDALRALGARFEGAGLLELGRLATSAGNGPRPFFDLLIASALLGSSRPAQP